MSVIVRRRSSGAAYHENGNVRKPGESETRRLSTSSGKGKGREMFPEDEPESKNLDEDIESTYESDEDESLHCAICLSVIDDRTVIQPCNHDAFCFACILAWCDLSRKCPLCISTIDDLLIHNIRSERDFQKHYLPPLIVKSDSPPQARSLQSLYEGVRKQLRDRPTHPRFKYADWKLRNHPAVMPEMDQEDLALEKRRYVYRHNLYVKHVASNRFTRYRDHTAQQVSSSPELRQRLTKWLRRELRVFEGVDLEFLVGYCVSIASQLELRSDSATRLLSEFLGDRDAEQLLHETYSFLRSPFKDIRNYDRAVQYDRPDRKITYYLPPPDGEITVISQERAPLRRSTRRPRSASFSSDSESGGSDEYRKRPKRRSSPRRRQSDVAARLPRQGIDTYVPDYSILNKRNSRRSEHRSRRTPPPDAAVLSPRKSRHASPEPITVENDLSLQSEEAQEELVIDSDLEDLISLGGSDLDSPPLATPQDVPKAISAPPKVELSILGRSRGYTPAAEEVSLSAIHAPSLSSRLRRPNKHNAREDGLKARLAFSVRGAARKSALPTIPNNFDIINHGCPDLVKRLSAAPVSAPPAPHVKPPTRRMSEVKQQELHARLLHARATIPKPLEQSQLHRGTVNEDLRTRLMARLEEERNAVAEHLQATPAAEEQDGKEEALRQNVLAILARRRGETIASPSLAATLPPPVDSLYETSPSLSTTGPNARMAELRARLQKEKSAHDAATPTPPPPPASAPPMLESADVSSAADRLAGLKAKMEREKKMANLRSKLMKEKAGLSV